MKDRKKNKKQVAKTGK